MGGRLAEIPIVLSRGLGLLLLGPNFLRGPRYQREVRPTGVRQKSRPVALAFASVVSGTAEEKACINSLFR